MSFGLGARLTAQELAGFLRATVVHRDDEIDHAEDGIDHIHDLVAHTIAGNDDGDLGAIRHVGERRDEVAMHRHDAETGVENGFEAAAACRRD